MKIFAFIIFAVVVAVTNADVSHLKYLPPHQHYAQPSYNIPVSTANYIAPLAAYSEHAYTSEGSPGAAASHQALSYTAASHQAPSYTAAGHQAPSYTADVPYSAGPEAAATTYSNPAFSSTNYAAPSYRSAPVVGADTFLSPSYSSITYSGPTYSNEIFAGPADVTYTAPAATYGEPAYAATSFGGGTTYGSNGGYVY